MSVAVRVIPCLDVDAGRVVKGVNFEHLRDAGDPVELAHRYDAEGADELTFLDISASHEGRATTLEVVSRCAEEVFIPLTVGGGVASVDDVDGKHTLTFQVVERPLLTTDEVQSLDPAMLLVRRTGCKPMRLSKLGYDPAQREEAA